MIRGLVPKDRLLEWSVEDGWEPLCKFLGKNVPEEAFPSVTKAFEGTYRPERVSRKYFRGALRNLLILITAMLGLMCGIYKLWI